MLWKTREIEVVEGWKCRFGVRVIIPHDRG